MALLKLGEFMEDDWVHLDEEETIPQGSDIIVPFDRLVAEFETLKKHNGSLGVFFPNDRSVEDLAPYLDQLAMITLTFPAYTDGRAYSQSRTLRTQMDYAGEVRASGNVLPDQLAFMRQCGFDVFDISGDDRAQERWQQSATAMSISYQRGYGPERGFAPMNALDRRKAAFDD